MLGGYCYLWTVSHSLFPGFLFLSRTKLYISIQTLGWYWSSLLLHFLQLYFTRNWVFPKLTNYSFNNQREIVWWFTCSGWLCWSKSKGNPSDCEAVSRCWGAVLSSLIKIKMKHICQWALFPWQRQDIEERKLTFDNTCDSKSKDEITNIPESPSHWLRTGSIATPAPPTLLAST